MADEQQPHPAIAGHPLFTGAQSVGMMTGEKPWFPAVESGNDALRRRLEEAGLQYEEADGHYNAPERSFLIYGATRDQLYQLGKKFGQESLIYSEGPGRRQFVYTNGPNDGTYHPDLPTHEFWPEEHGSPDDYWTHLPGRGYLRLHFNFDARHPLRPGAPVNKAEVAAALRATLEKVLAGA